MDIIRKNIQTLKAKLSSKKEENSKLKDFLKSLKEKVKTKKKRMSFYLNNWKRLSKEKEAALCALKSTWNEIGKTCQELEGDVISI